MSYLSKEQIIKADDLPRQDVEVPEWGGTVCVSGMTAHDRDQFEASFLEGKGKDKSKNFNNFRARLCSKAIVDPETHERMFSDAEIKELGKKSARALDRVFAVAQKLNSMSSEDVEEITGN